MVVAAGFVVVQGFFFSADCYCFDIFTLLIPVKRQEIQVRGKLMPDILHQVWS